MKTATTIDKSKNDHTPVAQDVFTYCTKEKIDTWHVVMNHNAAGIVDRVVCKACKSEHKYRKEPAAKKETRVASSSGRMVLRNSPAGKMELNSKNLEETWLAGIKKWGEKPVVTFDPGTSFKAGEVFEHSSFGKGVVQARREGRIDVLFSSGLKTLPSKINREG